MSIDVTVRHESFPALPNLPAMTGWVVTRLRRGISRDRRYAFYIWQDEASARKFADDCKTSQQVEVNVSSDRPYKLV